MPETSSQSVRCGQSQVKPPRDKMRKPEESLPPLPSPPPLPLPPPPQTRNVESPPASGSQCWSGDEGVRQKQQRPSVLRHVYQMASKQQHENYFLETENNAAASVCEKEGEDTGRPSPQMGSFLRQSHHLLPLKTDGPNQSSIETRLPDGVSEGSSALFVSGFCRWPGCDTVSKDFPSFLKHLHSEHSHGDRSVAQWRVQQDIVQYMESQLILEKQKLLAMQLHLHLSEHNYTDPKAASEWPYSLPLFLPQPQVTDGDRVQQWCMKQLEELSQHGYRAAASANLLTDVLPSIEFYKHKNIRPPYTYAYLIRWSIMESPEKQRTLNEIYNWFTTMFCYFRHNTATWKNAVRHNLSLHKCFVRVEEGKGAVWTVDETEYQRRKGQKYHRDCPVKWLTTCSQYYCPEDL